jgi:hypothetical protein
MQTSPGGGMADYTQLSAPSAFANEIAQRDPQFLPYAGGVRIRHSEKHCNVAAKNEMYALRVHPKSIKFLAGISEHFTNFRINKWEVRYAPRASTSVGVSVYMAPCYSSDIPVVKGGSSNLLLGRPLIDLSGLPGSRQFAAWAEGKVGWMATRATRSVFKLLNIVGAASPGGGANSLQEEAKTPGYVLCVVDADGSDTGTGSLWVDYDVTLIDPMAPGLGGVSYYKAETDGSALALQTARVSGASDSYLPYGNSIQFLVPGVYTVVISIDGTSTPLQDYDGHLIYDINDIDVTSARLLPVFDISSSAYDAALNPASYGVAAGTTTRSSLTFYVEMQYGDSIQIDNVTSGTLATTVVNISRGAPPLLLRA